MLAEAGRRRRSGGCVGPTEGQAGHNDGVGEGVWSVGHQPGRCHELEAASGVHVAVVNVVGGRWPRSGPWKAMAARRKLSVVPKATKKYIWARHWAKRMAFL